ncbi:hypothetical protein L3Q82_007277 [Scortum barcoo]|uniref:Uncharacterized protein n=1 Tax=Scortum barcoo TaxID=214431 RepID=A0ACB8WVM3_9TELE|nr:hypothetical protein L3Q82_007277 [Scortum barcoo]
MDCNGPLNAGSVREINSRVSPSKNMINTPPGDAAEDEVGAAGSGSVGTQGEVTPADIIQVSSVRHAAADTENKQRAAVCEELHRERLPDSVSELQEPERPLSGAAARNFHRRRRPACPPGRPRPPLQHAAGQSARRLRAGPTADPSPGTQLRQGRLKHSERTGPYCRYICFILFRTIQYLHCNMVVDDTDGVRKLKSFDQPRSLPSAPPPLLLHSNMALGQQPSKALYSSNHKEAQIRAELDGSQDPGPHSPGSWGQPIISDKGMRVLKRSYETFSSTKSVTGKDYRVDSGLLTRCHQQTVQLSESACLISKTRSKSLSWRSIDALFARWEVSVKVTLLGSLTDGFILSEMDTVTPHIYIKLEYPEEQAEAECSPGPALHFAWSLCPGPHQHIVRLSSYSDKHKFEKTEILEIFFSYFKVQFRLSTFG